MVILELWDVSSSQVFGTSTSLPEFFAPPSASFFNSLIRIKRQIEAYFIAMKAACWCLTMGPTIKEGVILLRQRRLGITNTSALVGVFTFPQFVRRRQRAGQDRRVRDDALVLLQCLLKVHTDARTTSADERGSETSLYFPV